MPKDLAAPAAPLPSLLLLLPTLQQFLSLTCRAEAQEEKWVQDKEWKPGSFWILAGVFYPGSCFNIRYRPNGTTTPLQDFLIFWVPTFLKWHCSWYRETMCQLYPTLMLVGIGQASRALPVILDAFHSRQLQTLADVHRLSFFHLPVLGHDRPSSLHWVINVGLQRVNMCSNHRQICSAGVGFC